MERKSAMRASVGREIAGRLRAFKKALQSNRAISERFTCKRVVLDLQPMPYEPVMVKETRKLLGLSQALFAQFLGVSVKTVRAWEQGKGEPSVMACRFMDEIRHDPKYWRKRLLESAREKEAGASC
jgi:putative transcriptional regulator